MQLGIVGLGRMGANMARRLMRDGHTIVAYDVNPDAVSQLEGEGAQGASSLEDLASKLSATRSAPEALEAYQKCAAQRMQMAADDGRRLLDECQNVTHRITRSLADGWPTGSTTGST